MRERYFGGAGRYAAKDEFGTRPMANDRVPLRPRRRHYAASGNPCLEHNLDTGACLIDDPLPKPACAASLRVQHAKIGRVKVTLLTPNSILRLVVAVPLLLLFLCAQGYWLLRFWRFASRIQSATLRQAVHGLAITVFTLVAVALTAIFFSGRRVLIWRFSGMMGVVGLWIPTAFVSSTMIGLVSVIHLAARYISSCLALASYLYRRAAEPSSGSSANAPHDEVRLDRQRFVPDATPLTERLPFPAPPYRFFLH